jgi:glycosyl transferase family 87
VHSLRKIDFRSPAVVALLVFVVAVPAFAVIKARTAPHYGQSKATAAKLALADQRVKVALEGHDVTRVRVTPLDDQEQRVSFVGGSRTIANAAVGPHGVTHVAANVESGSSVVNYPPMLIFLTLIFVLAIATVPLLSPRNLDVLALASFTGPIMLLNGNYELQSVCVAYPLLTYLAARCMATGLGIARGAPGASLLWHLMRNWPLPQRMRVMRWTVLAAAAVVAMVVPSSTGASDVAYAGVSGATNLLHGLPPYGHIPGFIFHGDTYPLLNYVLYIPGAALIPVYDSFSDPTGGLIVAGAAVLLAAAGLYRIGVRLAEEGHDAVPGAEEPRFAGMRIALAWLVFPPVILAASGGSNDAIVAACLVGAFAFFPRRVLSTFLLGVATWVKVLPALAIPIWLARLSLRGALQAIAAIAALSSALLGWLMILGGTSAVTAMLNALTFQLDRGSLRSLWLGLGISELQPVATALLVTAIVAAVVAVRRDRTLGDDLRRMTAVFAGVMLLAQIAANYWTWAYLPWALVPMLLSLLAPSAVATEAAQARTADRRMPGAAPSPLPSAGRT